MPRQRRCGHHARRIRALRYCATGKYECVYYFEKDVAEYIDSDGDGQDRLHAKLIATVDKATGRVTDVCPHFEYEQISFVGLMADE